MRIKITKFLSFIFVACMMCFVFQGCSSGETDSEFGSVGPYGEETASGVGSETFTETEEQNPNLYTTDDLDVLDGVYALYGDGKTIMKPDEVAESGNLWLSEFNGENVEDTNEIDFPMYPAYSDWLSEHSDYDVVCEPPHDGVVDPLVIDRNEGDQLILVGDSYYDDGFWVSKVVDQGFYSGILGDGTMTSYVDEVFGAPVDDRAAVEAALAGSGISFISGSCDLLVSDEPSYVDFGQYQGTEWVEGSQPLETSYYLVRHCFSDGSTKELTVQRTKNGYFVIDVSDLDPGVYILDIRMGDRAVPIEII